MLSELIEQATFKCTIDNVEVATLQSPCSHLLCKVESFSHDMSQADATFTHTEAVIS